MPVEAAQLLRAVHGAARPPGAARGRAGRARAARAEFGHAALPPAMVAALAVLEHRVALLTGNLPAAVQAADGSPPAPARPARPCCWRPGPRRPRAGTLQPRHRRAGVRARHPHPPAPHGGRGAPAASGGRAPGRRPVPDVPRWRRRWRMRRSSAWSGRSLWPGRAPRSC